MEMGGEHAQSSKQSHELFNYHTQEAPALSWVSVQTIDDVLM